MYAYHEKEAPTAQMFGTRGTKDIHNARNQQNVHKYVTSTTIRFLFFSDVNSRAKQKSYTGNFPNESV